MNKYLRNIVCLAFMCLPAAHPASTQTSVAKPQNTAAAYGRLPLSFEANQGQADSRVKFLSRGQGYSLFLTQQDAILALKKQGKSVSSGASSASVALAKRGAEPESEAVLRMRLVGANATAQVKGLEELPGKSNYFIGNDSRKWRTGIANYAKVKYANVYPGVDLVFYGNQRQLEFDLVVQPGADPQAVRLDFRTAINGEQAALRVDDKGDLVVSSKGGEVIFHKPVVYQPTTNYAASATHEGVIDGKFVLTGAHRVRFQIAAYDRSKPLVIDPTLAYSTYLGGNDYEQGYSIAVDASGNAYVTGDTYSGDFPTTAGAFQTKLGPGLGCCNDYRTDAFVTKLNATGSALVYSTFLGGGADDYGNSIAVDASGNAYVTGTTYSPDFPITQGAFQTTLRAFTNAFVSKLNATGSALIYSTYLGGSGSLGGPSDLGLGTAVDASGNAYVTGTTYSPDFPITPGALQTKGPAEGDGAAFVTKLNATGSALIYSTFLGGSNSDEGRGIALDANGNAYVTGDTTSSDFPTTPGAFQTTFGGHAFVSKLNATGAALIYSTYLGGSNYADVGRGLALDAIGNAYVTGDTNSSDFPTTPGAFQTTYGGGHVDAFVSKLNAAGSALIYSTYLGGSGYDQGYSIAVDRSGNAYVTGYALSPDFPTTSDAFQTSGEGAFVSKLNATGAALYSTYLGGSEGDTGRGIALDASGNAYVTGGADSSDFPTTPGAFQSSFGGIVDAFVSKFSFGVPFCSLKSRLELDVDGDRDDGFELGGRFALGAGSSIDPTTQPVTLTIANYLVTIPSGSFVKRHRSYEFAGRINGVRLAVLIHRQHREEGDRGDDEDNDNDGRDHHNDGWDHHDNQGHDHDNDGGDHDRCTTAMYTILAKARGDILKGTANPVTVTVSIGDNTGTTQVHAHFER